MINYRYSLNPVNPDHQGQIRCCLIVASGELINNESNVLMLIRMNIAWHVVSIGHDDDGQKVRATPRVQPWIDTQTDMVYVLITPATVYYGAYITYKTADTTRLSSFTTESANQLYNKQTVIASTALQGNIITLRLIYGLVYGLMILRSNDRGLFTKLIGPKCFSVILLLLMPNSCKPSEL